MQNPRRRLIYSIVAGTFFSLLLYFGTKFSNAIFNEKNIEYTPLDLIFPLIFIIALSFFFYFVLNIKIKVKEDENFNLKKWHIFFPLMLVSLIMLLTIFPGHYPYDSSVMYTYYQTENYTTHFSPAICFLIGIFFSFGKAIGSVNIGYALMIFLQFSFVNYALTEAIFYCSKNLKKKSFGIILTVFFIIHPLVQMLLIRSGQDTIFGGIFLLLCLEFLKISEDKKVNFMKISLLTFLLFITRNNGLYALIPTFIIGFFLLKETRKNFIISLLIPILAFFGYNTFFINNIVSEKDSIFKESINVPIIQIARAMYSNPDEESLNELSSYFYNECLTVGKGKWGMYQWSQGISDPYKLCLKTEEIEKDPLKFFNLWRKIGEKNPVSYAEAPMIFTLGLYYPYMPYDSGGNRYMWHAYVDSCFGERNIDGLEYKYFIPPLEGLMYGLIVSQNWSKIPVLHLLWGAPFTTYLCIFGIIFAFYRKKRKYLLPLSFILGLILTVALSPVMLFRYLFPAVIATPIMIYILIRIITKENNV